MPIYHHRTESEAFELTLFWYRTRGESPQIG